MKTRLSLAALSVALLGGLSSVARADIVTPSGLNPGDPFRIVFVSTTATAATSSDLTGYYDPIVSADAAAGGIATYHGNPVTWAVIGSTAAVSAISRLPADDVPIFLPSGTPVAASGAALWSTNDSDAQLLHQIDETAAGVSGVFAFVWTGTSIAGLPRLPFGSAPDVGNGNSFATNTSWIESGFTPNGDRFLLFGFSEVLIAPQVQSVPEPASITLLGLGALGLAGYSHRRQKRPLE